MQSKHELTNVCILYRSPAAFYECLVTVVIALLHTIATQQIFCISPWSNTLVKLMEVWYFSEIQEYNFFKLVGLTVNIME